MPLKTKKEALSSICERKRKDGTQFYDCYLGINAITRKPERMYDSSREALVDRIKQFYKTVDKGGEICTMLTALQMLDAKAAYDALAKAGMSISLVECVSRVLANEASAKDALPRKSITEAYDEYYAYAEEMSSNNAKTVRARVGRWVMLFSGESLLRDLTAKDVTDYLAKEYGEKSKVTYNGHLQYINMFLNWCREKPRCWILDNPLDGIKSKRVAYKEPKCIEVAHARELFKALYEVRNEHPEYIVYAAFSFFCGIRREEILRMAGKTEANDSNDGPAARIDMDAKTITILKPKGFMNGVRPRTFIMPDTAHAWLSSVDWESAIGRIYGHTVDDIYEIGRSRKAVIPKNCGRHSFITYHVCAYQNFAKTLLIVGHLDQKTSEDHYRALKPNPQEGLDYFGILPSLFA